MPDYVPAPDGDFDTWQANFLSFASANLAPLGLTANDLIPANAAQSAWNAAFPAHTAAKAAARNATQSKDDSRGTLEGALRALATRLQASPAVSDAERASLGITVPDTVRTPVPAPTTRPVVSVDTSQRFSHTLRLADESTPTRRARPAGVRAAEVWAKVGGPAPVDPSECAFLGQTTRSSFIASFAGEQGNQTAQYLIRWVSSRGEPGPWSETASASIAA
jgi:hypothetical protein